MLRIDEKRQAKQTVLLFGVTVGCTKGTGRGFESCLFERAGVLSLALI